MTTMNKYVLQKRGYFVLAKDSMDGKGRIVLKPRGYILDQMSKTNLLNVFAEKLGYGKEGKDVFEMLNDFFRFKDNEQFWIDILHDNFKAVDVDPRGKREHAKRND